MSFFSFPIIEFSQFLVKIVSHEKFRNILVSKRFKKENFQGRNNPKEIQTTNLSYNPRNS